VQGAWHLHALTEALPLDFFVLFSSVSSFLGSAAQSNDAAANSFLDALARARRVRDLPALSICWGPFLPPESTRKNPHARATQRGVRSLSIDEGLALFNELLGSPAVEVAPIPLDGRQVLEYYPQLATSRRFAELLVDTGEAAPTAPANVVAELRALPKERRAAALEKFVCDQLALVLGLDASAIGPTVAFSDLGMDSLMGLELRNNLEASLGLRLSASMVYGYPNSKALCGYFVRELDLLAEAQASAEAEPAPEAPLSKDEAMLALQRELLLTADELASSDEGDVT
jgi:myxalamid-type polyketide synthase MxaE and MxaD